MADTQAVFNNYLAEAIIDNTYYRFMMWSAEGRRIDIVDYDDKYLMMTTHCLAGSMVLPDV